VQVCQSHAENKGEEWSIPAELLHNGEPTRIPKTMETENAERMLFTGTVQSGFGVKMNCKNARTNTTL